MNAQDSGSVGRSAAVNPEVVASVGGLAGGESSIIEVVGTGLIGTSVGLAATAAGYQVLLRDADPDHVAHAVERGAGQPAADFTLAPDLVVVAVPPSVAAAVVVEALQRFPEATVTDVCSVKSPVVASVATSGLPMSRYVPGHPMAGRETSGPGAATADLFRGRPWLISPDQSTDPDHVAKLVAFVESLGAIPQFLPSAEHDRMVALTSHTPQVVSSLLGVRLAASPALEVAVVGQGLRDVARLAGSDAALWREILTANAAEVLPVLRGFADDLAAVVADVERAAQATGDAPAHSPAQADVSGAGGPGGAGGAGGAGGVQLADAAGQGVPGDVIERMLRMGNTGAARLPAKHGGEAADYEEMQVEIPDTPGSLGALFLAAGEAGINLEDVRIEHTVGRLMAIAHLYVLPQNVERLRWALLAGGWPVLQS